MSDGAVSEDRTRTYSAYSDYADQSDSGIDLPRYANIWHSCLMMEFLTSLRVGALLGLAGFAAAALLELYSSLSRSKLIMLPFPIGASFLSALFRTSR
jgi:hypothetical protein